MAKPLNSTYFKATAFWLLGLAGLLAVLALIDFMGGYWGDTAVIRRSALQFRSEATALRVATKYLVPHLNHVYEYTGRPLDEVLVSRNALRRFRTDARGVVQDNFQTFHLQESREILFLGGSTTETNEVDEPFRFPALVGRNLSEILGKPIVGINAGVRGHTTQDSLNLLLNHPSYQHALIVVLMHNINDRLLLAVRQHYQSFLQSDAPATGIAVKETLLSFLQATWDYVSYRSNVLFLFRTSNPWTGEQLPVYEETIDFQDPNIQMSTKKFQQNLIIFVKVVQSMHKVPVLMTQPLGRQSDLQTRFNDIIRLVCREQNVTLIDLDEVLVDDRTRLFFGDAIHLNNWGSRKVATIITDHFLQLLAKEPNLFSEPVP